MSGAQPLTAAKKKALLPLIGNMMASSAHTSNSSTKVVTPAHMHARAHTHFYTEATGVTSTKRNTQRRKKAESLEWCADSDSGALVLGLEPW